MSSPSLQGDEAFYGLLSGIAKAEYCGQTQITEETLKETLYGNNAEEFASAYATARRVLQAVISQDMEIPKLELYLKAQASKKTPGALTEAQAAVVLKFWRAQRSKIIQSLSLLTAWSPRLVSQQWRVDSVVKKGGQGGEETIEGVLAGIVEWKIEDRDTKNVRGVRVEVSGEQLRGVVQQLDAIDALLADMAQ